MKKRSGRALSIPNGFPVRTVWIQGKRTTCPGINLDCICTLLSGTSRLSTIRPVYGDDRLMTIMPLECGSNYSRKGFPHIDGTCALKFTPAFSFPCLVTNPGCRYHMSQGEKTPRFAIDQPPPIKSAYVKNYVLFLFSSLKYGLVLAGVVRSGS